MENQKVRIYQQRDFGQVMNAAFAFLRQEFKPMIISILILVGPLILLSLFFKSINQYNLQEKFSSGNQLAYSLINLLSTILMVLINDFTLIIVTCYIKYYAENNEVPSTFALYKSIAKYIFPLIVTNIISGILIIIGLICCVVPGLYLLVSLVLFQYVLILEDKSIGNSFDRSFKLAHHNWWRLLLLGFLVILIYCAFYIIISIPLLGTMLPKFIETFKFHKTFSEVLSVPVIVYQSFIEVVSHLLYIIPFLIFTFYYYSLTEEIERTSLLKQIETMDENE